jgi:hypothetical protein
MGNERNKKDGNMTQPQPVRALALARECLPKSKDADYILRLLETKARRAEEKAPAKTKRKAIRKLLRLAGETPKTKSDWLREADKWFSRFIRLRDADGKDFVKCATCTKFYALKDIECGHWIRRGPPKGSFGTRFNEVNAHSQGACCNRFDYGAEAEHEKFISRRYGPSMPDKLRDLARMFKRKQSSKELEAISKTYEAKVTALGGWPEKSF